MRDYSLFFIQFCFIVFFLYWIVMAFSVKRTLTRAPRWQNWRFYAFAVVMISIVFFGRKFALRGGIVLWQHTMEIGIIGDIVTITGLIIAIWARTILAGNWSAAVVIKENHELIERGPYALARHPIYTGILLMILGLAIDGGRLFWLIAFCVCLVGLRIKAHKEETLLTQYFPGQYPAYKARVKALIPFII